MDPSKSTLDPPRSIDNNANHAAMDTPQCDISDSLNRLSLANATATPLPKSPSLLSPDAPSHPSHHNQPAPRRSPSSSSLRNERRKSIPALQKRSSTASLRSSSGNNGPLLPARRRVASLVRQFRGVPYLGDLRRVAHKYVVAAQAGTSSRGPRIDGSFYCRTAFQERERSASSSRSQVQNSGCAP